MFIPVTGEEQVDLALRERKAIGFKAREVCRYAKPFVAAGEAVNQLVTLAFYDLVKPPVFAGEEAAPELERYVNLQ